MLNKLVAEILAELLMLDNTYILTSQAISDSIISHSCKRVFLDKFSAYTTRAMTKILNTFVKIWEIANWIRMTGIQLEELVDPHTILFGWTV